jgi:hypothetical protein
MLQWAVLSKFRNNPCNLPVYIFKSFDPVYIQCICMETSSKTLITQFTAAQLRNFKEVQH